MVEWMSVSLENIEEFSVPLEEYGPRWFFTDENRELATQEHRDQICPLTKEAAQFLWDYERSLDIDCSPRFFKTVSVYNSAFADQQAIKKYLYNLGIPFSQKVFIAYQPGTGFVLTWKMVVKYAHRLFWANDQIVWDKTLNWRLEFHHDGEFRFGKDLIYDGQQEVLRNKAKLRIALEAMEARRRRNSFD